MILQYDGREKFRLALPKGRFKSISYSVLRALGTTSVAPRVLQLATAGDSVSAFLLRPADIPRGVASGEFDLGLVPEEWWLEFESVEGLDLRRHPQSLPGICTRLSFFGVEGAVWPPDKAVRVATCFPNLAKRLLKRCGVADCVILPFTGSIEALVPSVADIGFDCIETGTTIRANGLSEIYTPFEELKLCLVYRCHMEHPVVDTVASHMRNSLEGIGGDGGGGHEIDFRALNPHERFCAISEILSTDPQRALDLCCPIIRRTWPRSLESDTRSSLDSAVRRIMLCLGCFDDCFGRLTGYSKHIYILGENTVAALYRLLPGVSGENEFVVEQSIEMLAACEMLYCFCAARKFGYLGRGANQIRLNGWGRAFFEGELGGKADEERLLIRHCEKVISENAETYASILRACSLIGNGVAVSELHRLNAAVPLPVVI